jgi:prepilin signal peptidase PulO-like enzyme (type II secretory pathway)
MISVFLFIIGACIGSFLGVLIDRLPKEEPILLDRSKCDFCGKVLAWQSLIPIISYLWFKGKSSCCHKKLSWFYPVIEVLTGVLFVLSYLLSPTLLLTIVYCILGSILLVIFFTDLFDGVVPVLFVALGIGVILVFYFLTHTNWVSPFLGFMVAGGLFGLLILVTKGKGMGLGDLSFSILMGLVLQFPGIITGLYIAFLTGAVVSLILVLTKKKKLKGGSVPFIPFLIFATVFTYIYGSEVTSYFAAYFPHF